MMFDIGQTVKTTEHSEGVYVGEVGTIVDAEKRANVELYVAEFPGKRLAHFTKSMLVETDEKKAICFDCKKCEILGIDSPGYYICNAEDGNSDVQTMRKYAQMLTECSDFVS